MESECESVIGSKTKACISAGNMKLGKMPNFSLAPGVTCSREACATCFTEGCYARKAYRLYPQTKAAWDRNTDLALHDLTDLQAQLVKYFTKNRPNYFRLHVSGDFVSPEYTAMWRAIAARFQETHFLAFTKQYEMVRAIDWPINVAIVFSACGDVQRPGKTIFTLIWNPKR